MNQANIAPGLPTQGLGTQDYLSQTAAAPEDQGFEGELSLALAGQVSGTSAEAGEANSDDEQAAHSDASLQNMPVVLPWLPTLAANFSTLPEPGSKVPAAFDGQTDDPAGQAALLAAVGQSAAQPESGGAFTQAVQAVALATPGMSTGPTNLPVLPTAPTAASEQQPEAASLPQAAAALPGDGRPYTGPSPSAAVTAAAALQAQPLQGTAPALDSMQADSAAADLKVAAPQPSVQALAQASAAGLTQPRQPVSETAAQAQPLQPSASMSGRLDAQALDRPSDSIPTGSTPVATDTSALGSAQTLSQPQAMTAQGEAAPAPAQTSATAQAAVAQTAAIAAADAATQPQPGATAPAQAGHVLASAQAGPSSARLGIEAAEPGQQTADAADADTQAAQTPGQSTAAPASQARSAPGPEPLNWSSSPVTVSTTGGAPGSPSAAPALPPTLDVSLPIKPHWVSLEGGAVQVEVLRMAREGGGQVTLELTPPDQGRYRLDLRIDDFGRASLVVEGVSESMRTRLEMGESSLRDQFAQMGLQLSLQMRSQQGQADSGGTSPSPQAWAAGSDADAGLTPKGSPKRRTVALDLDRSLVRLYA